MRVRPTPQSQHLKRHSDPALPVDECWSCQRDRVICRSKIAFASVAEADEWVDDVNAGRGYTGRTVTRYACPWCPGWHMKTARSRRELARVERARRKELIKTRETLTS